MTGVAALVHSRTMKGLRSGLRTGLHAGLVLATLAFIAPRLAASQTVYRCGGSYSHVPCEGGRPLASQDIRTTDETRQAEQAARRERMDGDALEKERLGQESAARGSGRAHASKSSKASRMKAAQAGEYSAAVATPRKKKKAVGDEFFTVADPATLGKKKKKSAATKKASAG